jgi:hypothetical protein
MIKLTSKKATRHKCDEIFCTHCNVIKKKDHKCFMKIRKLYKNPTYPTLYFYDFETCVDNDGYMIPF